ncbi:uncharacterized protein LOC129778929 isoform X2 [Toxorhynchites rutilus septentrionalis]|uniref:uncharacterized protein LOC129778929 isoform X2 n=1 Tax=Toxorhynchites rutilus septentrionalis TaxID=329112 RepID=UPI00247B25D4|nr:uncharacterized protein LOC129778929 isoform X2 [Toxorhynchites rutilus septentrionalis]
MITLEPDRLSLTWWFRIRSNLESLNQFLIALKLFGVMIFTVVNRENFTIRVTLSDWLLLAVLSIARIWGTLTGIVRKQWQPYIRSELESVTYVMAFPIFCVPLLVVLIPIYVMFHQRRIEDMLRALKDVDDGSRRIGYLRNHRYHHFTTTMYLLMCLAFLLSVLVITMLIQGIEYVSDATFFITMLTMAGLGYTLYHTALNVMILAIITRLILLNRCLKEKLQFEGAFNGRKAELVIQLAKLFDSLCDATDAINIVLCIPHQSSVVDGLFVLDSDAYAIHSFRPALQARSEVCLWLPRLMFPQASLDTFEDVNLWRGNNL